MIERQLHPWFFRAVYSLVRHRHHRSMIGNTGQLAEAGPLQHKVQHRSENVIQIAHSVLLSVHIMVSPFALAPALVCSLALAWKAAKSKLEKAFCAVAGSETGLPDAIGKAWEVSGPSNSGCMCLVSRALVLQHHHRDREPSKVSLRLQENQE